ncbi:cytochrome P450 [Acidiferrimicrobium sp. IK]|uniref:cytochrome P450 n=1 Tax=Acidiferrimicrobium sp. IK TaxID=2871700 RepID=UPI0021CB028E|nr:cytochrome P450 [Acidiferrimicrobium sp. IK]MCU4187396.1 cytochrome P450 [Acidiferrimicrobium sp. IK]
MTSVEENTRAVQSWTDDFDVLDPQYTLEPDRVWRGLRESCPVAHTERYGSTWMPVEYADLTAIAHDIDHFSSLDIAVITAGREVDPLTTTMLKAPPITSDPPEHTAARRLLLPAFSPGAVDALIPVTRKLANELIDRFIGGSEADAAVDYAQHIPVRIIAEMLGVPTEDEAIFTGWAVTVIQQGFTNVQGAIAAVTELIDYFRRRIADRLAVPEGSRPDDVLTLLVESRIDGEPLSDHHLVGSCFLLLLAGIDTTWSGIGSSLWHLATHPDDQQRLRDDPGLMDTAVEEFLRFYSPVTMARYVAEDVEYKGCPMTVGDKVILTFPAANRDPAVFDRADEFVIDRAKNRHLAFGAGIHRCLGSNLARMEMRVALETWLARVPTFELADADAVVWTGGQVRGPRRVPVRW